MGKAYANRKPVDERPESDFYSTPYCLTWKLLELGEFDYQPIYEPAAGNGAISSQLRNWKYLVVEDDIRTTGKDFLTCNQHFPYIISNPPFSLFDEFVLKAKECSDKFAFIMKTNFFGAHSRYKNGIWKNLKSVYIFDRQVDYRSPIRDDGLVHLGNLITAWGIWDKDWKKDWWETRVISIQEYCKLGAYKTNEDLTKLILDGKMTFEKLQTLDYMQNREDDLRIIKGQLVGSQLLKNSFF